MGRHGLGLHVEPWPWKVLVPVHAAGICPAVHTPVFEQHAPRKAVQGFVGVHTVPEPRYVLVPVHPLGCVIVHPPVAEQQAPWQALGVHTVPLP